MQPRILRRRATALAAVTALLGSGVVGAVAAAAPAGATTASQATSEIDCATNGTTAPFVFTTIGSANPDPQFYSSQSVNGQVNGVAVTIIGGFVAGIANSVAGTANDTYGLSGSLDWGTSNASLMTGPTSTLNFSGSGNAAATAGLKHFTATTTAGSSTVAASASTFAAGDVGKAISAPGLPSSAFIGVVVDATHVVVVDPTGTPIPAGTFPAAAGGTTSPGTGNGVISGDLTIVLSLTGTTSATFTTAALAPGGTAGIELKGSTSGFQFAAGIPLPFTGCALTGGGTGVIPAPQAPPASPNPFATVALNDPAPTPNTPPLINVGTGTLNNSITLTASSSNATNANSFKINTVPAAGTLKVGGVTVAAGATFPATSANTLNNVTYDAPGIVGPQSFTFSVADSNNTYGATATVSLQVGTPPVDQTLTQVVNGGQLVLSCTAPPSQSNAPATALTTCAPITLPAIQLNGSQQVTGSAITPIYVSDNRGDPTTAWSLSSYMVQNGANNTNAGCASALDFCNQGSGVGGNGTPSATLAQNHISAENLTISGLTCTAVRPGNLNADGTPHAGSQAYGSRAGQTYANPATTTAAPGIGLCSTAAPNGGGTFQVTGNFQLVIPDSTAAGTYVGVVEYLVV